MALDSRGWRHQTEASEAGSRESVGISRTTGVTKTCRATDLQDVGAVAVGSVASMLLMAAGSALGLARVERTLSGVMDAARHRFVTRRTVLPGEAEARRRRQRVSTLNGKRLAPFKGSRSRAIVV